MRKFLCFVETAFFSISVPFLARLFSFERLLKIVEPRRPWPRNDVPSVEELAIFVDRLLRYRLLMRKQLCFRRSLVLYRFLRKLGVPAQLNFSVLPYHEGQRLKAHAWLSLDGKPILESGDAHAEYELIYSHSGKGSR